MKLSIIIPAYNAGKYIRRCLSSIIDQEWHNEVEIIVIDDGSTDDTAKVVKEYTSIIYLYQKNRGVSHARNTGLEIASGDVIWFCDADDYIVKNGLSFAIDHFWDETIDILTFRSITLDKYVLTTWKEPHEINGQIITECNGIAYYCQHSPAFVTCQLYRKSIINTIRFRDMTIAEDCCFNLEVFMKNPKVRAIDTCIYRYTENENQATRQRDKLKCREAVDGYFTYFGIVNDFIQSQPEIEQDLRKINAKRSTSFFSRVLSAQYSLNDFREHVVNKLNEIKTTPFIPIGKPQKVTNLILRHPWLYPLTSRIYNTVFIPYILPRLPRN